MGVRANVTGHYKMPISVDNFRIRIPRCQLSCHTYGFNKSIHNIQRAILDDARVVAPGDQSSIRDKHFLSTPVLTIVTCAAIS
jgi:hypothetical protein